MDGGFGGGGWHAAKSDYSVNSPFNLTGFPLFSLFPPVLPFQENKQFSFILKNRNFIHRQDRLLTRLITLCVLCGPKFIVKLSLEIVYFGFAFLVLRWSIFSDPWVEKKCFFSCALLSYLFISNCITYLISLCFPYFFVPHDFF